MPATPEPLTPDGRVSEATLGRLRTAVDALDRPAAANLAAQLAEAIRRADALNLHPNLGAVLAALRRLRLFGPMRDLAEAAVDAAPGLFEVRRQYAQALIEHGESAAALAVLRALVDDTAGSNPSENAEARGLIGRVHKQAYVEAAAPALPRYQDRLRQAVHAYLAVYQQDPLHYRWQGVNALALLHRAARDGVPVAGAPDPADLAADLLQSDLAATPLTPWDLATAMEAAVGLGDIDRALGLAYRYVRCPGVDAFMLAGTLRQMTEVWELGRDHGGPRQEIVDLLRAHLLDMEHGGLQISSAETQEGAHTPDAEDRRLERVLGRDAYVTIEWYRRGLTTAQAVAKVRSGPNPVGTGFLLRSDHVGLGGPPRPVLVTNNHVLATMPLATATTPDYAEVVFEAAPGGPFETRVERIDAELPPTPGLDVTVATLRDVPNGVEPLLPSLAPPVNDPDAVRLYTIGHPRGAGLAFSIQDNLLLDLVAPRIHYRTPTDPGSSGSPVLNHDWNVVGVHRAGGRLWRLDGSGTYAANEGVLIHAIAERMQTTFSRV